MIIEIKKGLLGYAFIAFCVVARFWLMAGFFRIIFEEVIGTSSITPGQLAGALLLTGSLGSLCLYGALSVSRQEYWVSLEGIEVRRLRKPRFIAWKEVISFWSMQSNIGISNYAVGLADGTNVVLFMSLMARPERSTKALFEAAYFANPNIQYMFRLGDEYGKPPYGIFKRERLK